MKKLLLLSFILFCSTIYTFPQTETRAASAWQVKGYDIDVSINDRTLTSSVVLNLQNIGNAAGTRLTLRINDAAEVSSVQLNGAAATFTKGQEPLGTSKNLQRILVNLPSIQPNALFTIKVDYKLKIDENTGLNAISPIGSQFLPLSFWYPTPNSHYAPKGADFAPFKLTVNSTQPIISSGTSSGTTFEQKLNGQPFFLTGNWETLESKGVTVYLPKGATDLEKQRANEVAALVTESSAFTANLLGGLPNVPFKIVAARRGAGFSDSGTILLDYATFRRQKLDSLTAMTIADSVAKVWVGNAKLVRGEGYGVIREGLSRFIATQFIEKQFGKASGDAERSRQIAAYSIVARNDSPFNIAAPLDPTYYPSVTYKGAMIWRVLTNQLGQDNFFNSLKTLDVFSLQGVKSALTTPFEVLDFPIANTTDTNLLAGLPRVEGTETKVSLRNTGSVPVNVNVSATTEKGEKLIQKASILPKSFGEVSFKTTSKIIRAEIDPEKFYPQTDFSDDVAPREFVESNPIVSIKRAFDKQDYTLAQKNARTILQNQPYLDEAKTWLGRALLADNKPAEAETIFQSALNEKLPTPFTLAWANLGLGDISIKSNKSAEAAKYYENAVKADAEYGATLAGRIGGQKITTSQVEESIKGYFVQFDKAVTTTRKTEVDALILPGEVTRFSGGVVGGQPERWETKVIRTEKIDETYSLAETLLTVKRLGNENIETGTAVFVLARVGSYWKLAGVEVFEVR